jgi:acid stress-induced BolA-like protein IbaG/YrbA
MGVDEIKRLIETGLSGSQAEVEGDGTHFSAVVICEVFTGKPMLQQHRLVYQALGDKVGTDIHALSIKTYTPEQWQKEKELRVI